MSRNRIKSVLALALAALMLSACNIKNGKPVDTGGPVKQKLEHVYRENVLSVAGLSDAESGNTGATLIDAAGGRAYFNRYRYVEVTEEAPQEGGYQLYEIISVALDGSETEPRVHYTLRNGGRQEENVFRNAHVNGMKCLPDGTFAIITVETYEDYSDEVNPVYSESTVLRLFDASWNETAAINVKELLGDETQYVYVNGVVKTDDGTLYVNCQEVILAIDETGERLFELKPAAEQGADIYMETLVLFSDGRAAVNVNGYAEGKNTREWRVIDKNTRGWGESIPFALPGNMWVSGYSTGYGEYLLCYTAGGRGVYGVTPSGESKEIVSFINSDIDGSSINNVLSLGGGEFIMQDWGGYVSGGSASGPRLVRLVPVPDAENKEKIILKAATLWDDYTFRSNALKFNRSSEEYKITIEDYSAYNTDGNWEVGISKLKADLITGNVPDILVLNEQLDIPMLAGKGLLADLYEMMDLSDKVSREDFLESVFKADEIDGKLYRLIPSFYIGTVTAKRALVGDTIGWTLDDLERVLAGMPEGTLSFFMMDRTNALNMGMRLGMSQFIDWSTGTCSFDEDFARLLEFAKGFPETINYNNWTEEDWMRYQYYQRDDLAILSNDTVMNYRSIRDYEERAGEEITFVGFPTFSGSGSVLYPTGQYAISARGEHKEVCFDFLLGFIETEPSFKDSGGYFYGGFSISRAYMDKVREYEMTPLVEREGYIAPDDSGGVSAYPYSISRGGGVMSVMPAPVAVPEADSPGAEDTAASYHLTRAEVDAVDALIASTTQIYTEYSEVMNIVMEEAESYFAGRKSAEETAKLVQSRVQIYISESR
ncbi:MAG: extracellular solute-binding protein [Oscillospiraceae bacterium]|jgi:ABC-type glycerol-3-phosphate transport system substrate-binding protein|nr:extracellular solute-binding protein [Oscillospiraceae bacterium]